MRYSIIIILSINLIRLKFCGVQQIEKDFGNKIDLFKEQMKLTSEVLDEQKMLRKGQQEPLNETNSINFMPKI